MKPGDIVRVKDCIGYNAYMQSLVGHCGSILKLPDSTYSGTTVVLLLGKIMTFATSDLEVISESR